jgi:hypothetical protein
MSPSSFPQATHCLSCGYVSRIEKNWHPSDHPFGIGQCRALRNESTLQPACNVLPLSELLFVTLCIPSNKNSSVYCTGTETLQPAYNVLPLPELLFVTLCIPSNKNSSVHCTGTKTLQPACNVLSLSELLFVTLCIPSN